MAEAQGARAEGTGWQADWPPAAGAPGGRYLVLSDMHFGTRESAINDPRLRAALVEHLASRAPWKEVVLAGDILDVNLSTLVRSLEGGPGRAGEPEVVGFRTFLGELHAALAGRGGLPALAEAWVYLPGNHDYKLWDLHASRVMCTEVLAAGRSLRSVHPPLARARWAGASSFFAGVFRAFGAEGRVAVEYPDHVLDFGGQRMVVTHGHHADASQTRFRSLASSLAGKSGKALEDARRDVVIETAQYQAVANAVSYRRDTAQLVSGAVGPDGWLPRLQGLLFGLLSWLLAVLLLRGATWRGRAISPRQLRAIDCYLRELRGYHPLPRWFLFGHTHRQGRDRLGELEVVNAGSCYPDRGLPITFLEVEADALAQPSVRLMCVDGGGRVRPSEP